MPVSLAQIGLDLDAQLLEFTLMAKAREQAGDEVDKTEEAVVHVSTQGETTRLTAKVGQLSILPHFPPSTPRVTWMRVQRCMYSPVRRFGAYSIHYVLRYYLFASVRK